MLQARVPSEFDAGLQSAARAFAEGRAADARALAAGLEPSAQDSAARLVALGELLTHLADHRGARRVYEAANRIAPRDPAVLYNLASALIATGAHAEAEATLDAVIALQPADGDAWYNRSTLRRQTRERNHTLELQAVLARSSGKAQAIPLGFALAKEREDLEDWEGSIRVLKAAADLRRSRLSYDVEVDIQTMSAIAEAFDKAWAQQPAEGADGAPIFVLGLPRTGSTLVDRILSAHSQVASLGEVPDFALALVALAGGGSRAELLERAAGVDPAALGRAYQARVAGYGVSAGRLIDKTPSNFLYLGPILKAFPDASVAHLTRHPMDACYAIYKTLFRMGYPYSYDLVDLARYYAAYDRLMNHWRLIFPGRVIEVSYEALANAPEAQTRRLLEACNLPFEADCLAFHDRAGPAATASAVQVRQPIHQRSVGLWRRYERELRPLRDALLAEGVAAEALA
jgi:tetratricopeptide (TPR) repeat protein